MQDPTEKHFGDVGILDKYEVNNNNNNSLFLATDLDRENTEVQRRCFSL